MGVKKLISQLFNYSYACNKLYNNVICLTDDFIELKGGLKK